MSAQPIAPPRTDIEILQALDFEPDHACEFRPLRQPCRNAAVYLIAMRKTCGCPAPAFAICQSCWEWLDTLIGVCFHCPQCTGHVSRVRDEAFVIVCTFGGA